VLGKVLGGRYTLLERIGAGGMAVVYKAHCSLLDRMVAVKILREELSQDEQVVQRFKREAQSVARLSHPNIVSIYDVGSEAGYYYIVMEYIDGITLKEAIQSEQGMKPERALQIAIQVCSALSHAHRQGIIHRDIKPQNIILSKDDAVKVTDFGIALAAAGGTLTHSGKLLGSVHYISPEQAKGSIIDQTSDLYSLGAVLYELITGRVPFEGDSPIAVAFQHVNAPIVPPAQILPALAPSIDYLINKSLSKNPRQRFATAQEMQQALEAALEGKSVDLIESRLIVSTGASDSAHTMQLNPVAKAEKTVIHSTSRNKWPRLAWSMGLLLLVAVAAYLMAPRFVAVPDLVVPSVQGKMLEEALHELQQSGLQGTVLTQEFNASVGKNRVISQVPVPNALVKPGREIQLAISLGPAMGIVPNLKGKNFDESSVLIANAGFIVGAIEPVFLAQTPLDEVLSQIPAAETQQPLGTPISLIVNRGQQQTSSEMPSLLTLTIEEGGKLASQLEIVISPIREKPSDQFFAGHIIEQDVLPGTKLMPGSTVGITVSSGPGPAAKTEGFAIRMPESETRQELIVTVTDQKSQREEYRGFHESGELVNAIIHYFGAGKAQAVIDGKLIKEKQLH